MVERVNGLTDFHLRSCKEVSGYHVQGNDGAIGHIDDFIVDDESWVIRHLVVDTSNWWVGRKILLAPHWASRVRLADKRVFVDLPRQMIKDSPEWVPTAPVNRVYEARFYDYYGHPAYWASGQPVSRPQPETGDMGRP